MIRVIAIMFRTFKTDHIRWYGCRNFSFKILEKAINSNLSTSDKEHVTKYFLRSDKIKKKLFT